MLIHVRYRFYIAYIVFQFTTLGWKFFRPHHWVSFVVFFWGITSTMQAVCTSWGGLVACRFLLGVAETMFGPGIPLYFSYFYPPEYIGLRFGIFLSGAALASSFQGPLWPMHMEVLWHMLYRPSIQASAAGGFYSSSKVYQLPSSLSFAGSSSRMALAMPSSSIHESVGSPKSLQSASQKTRRNRGCGPVLSWTPSRITEVSSQQSNSH